MLDQNAGPIILVSHNGMRSVTLDHMSKWVV